jgi:putative ABC transport system permease protein
MVPETTGISLGESIGIAFDTLLANKLRTVLTALGVIIGVAAVVALLALGRGAQQQVADAITANGANLLTVRSGSLGAGGFGSAGGNARSLTMDDAEALANPANVPAAKQVSSETMNFGTVVSGSESTSAMVIGVTPTYLPVHNGKVETGEFFNDSHLRKASNVAVIGSRIATTFFQQPSAAVGQPIKINGQRFRVIGVLAEKGGSGFASIDDGVLIPLTTGQRKLYGSRDETTGKPSVSEVAVQAQDDKSVEDAEEQIKMTLRRLRELPLTGGADDFSVDNQQDLINTLTESRRTLTLYLGAIAAISLVVGGIGIMNIMLVSVRERTREIGLRKAVGARERDILTQFLFEALTLSTVGGLIGLAIGVLIAVVANISGQARASVSPASVVLAISFAMAIGLFFGIEPARRAAKLDPIEALRYD